MWRHTATIAIKDPETIDKESIKERLSSLSDVGLTTRGFAAKGTSSTTAVSIGAIELLEVSDVVPVKGKETYSVGFKCRFKANALGELFDVSSPIFTVPAIGGKSTSFVTDYYLGGLDW